MVGDNWTILGMRFVLICVLGLRVELWFVFVFPDRSVTKNKTCSMLNSKKVISTHISHRDFSSKIINQSSYRMPQSTYF